MGTVSPGQNKSYTLIPSTKIAEQPLLSELGKLNWIDVPLIPVSLCTAKDKRNHDSFLKKTKTRQVP